MTEIPRYFLHMGRAFRVLSMTQGENFVAEANAFMAQNDNAGLLHADDAKQIAIVADNDDKGVIVFGSGDRPRMLDCCCCGGGGRGRQWWNQDTGYGLCAGCIDYCARNETVKGFESCYGLRGIHFDIIEGARA